jgi:hypothetical protein
VFCWLGGMASQDEEHLIETRLTESEVGDADSFIGQPGDESCGVGGAGKRHGKASAISLAPRIEAQRR